MAEEEKKVVPRTSDPVIGAIEAGVIALFVLAIADGIRRFILGLLGRVNENLLDSNYWLSVWTDMVPMLKIIGGTLATLFLIGIVHLTRKINMIRGEEHRALYPARTPEIGAFDTTPEKIVNKKWESILSHIESENPSDWKLAILEADIMLEELLDKLGYHGETIGEKLKSVEKSDFTTLDLAWEAHKIRNSIAHEGTDFLLNQREAKRVIDLYREVFEEFFYI